MNKDNVKYLRCKLYISLYYNCAVNACSLLTSDHNLKYKRCPINKDQWQTVTNKIFKIKLEILLGSDLNFFWGVHPVII